MGVRAVKLYFKGVVLVASLLSLLLSVLVFSAYRSDPANGVWLQYFSMFVPFMLLTNLALTVYWLFSWKPATFIAITAFALNVYYVSSIPSHKTESIENGTRSISVASYNVNYFSHEEQQNAPRIASVIKMKNTDILAMQEFQPTSYYNVKEIIGEFDYLENSAIYSGSGEGIGMAIFSRFPILRSKKTTFPNSDNGYMWADILFNNDTIRVINCHLQTTGYYSSIRIGYNHLVEKMSENFIIRAIQAAQVRSLIDTTKHPVILCGDLNDTPKSFVYSKVKGNDLIDSFGVKGLGIGGTYRWSFNLLRIDYIMHSKHFKTLKYEMEPAKLSDHKPIFSVLEYQN